MTKYNDAITTYVYDKFEVKKTGRFTRKETTKRQGRHRFPSVTMLYEITPVDTEQGSWKVWVRQDQLLEIQTEKSSENSE